MQGSRTEILVNGARLVLDPSGAAYWPITGALIVSDLHFEKGSAYAARGVALPPYDTRETLSRLEACIAAFRPTRVIALGDSFHDTQWQGRVSAEDFTRLEALAARVPFNWILGNHDPEPPRALAGTATAELRLSADGDLCFRHEPLVGQQPGEVCGHLHPCAKIRTRGRSLRRRCFASDGQRLVLPAFGALTGSLNVCDAAYAPVFPSGQFTAYLVGRTGVAPIGAAQLLPDRTQRAS